MSNARYAIRQLLRRPTLSVVVIAMLAVGIGASTAMFSWVHAVLLNSLPVPAAERLVNLGAPGPKPGSNSCSIAGDCAQVFSYPMFRDLEQAQRVFSGMAGHRFFRANLSYDGANLADAGVLVSGSYFDVLQLTPAAGRLISPADEPAVGESPVVVLSHDYWRSGFDSDPGVIGNALTVNGQELSIIGVAPAGFSGTTVGAKPKVFVPLTLRWNMEPTITTGPDDRMAYWLYVFARLQPDVSIEQARAGINTVYSGILNDVEAPLNAFLPPDVMERFRQRQITVEPGDRGQSDIAADAGTPLMLLLGITGVLLLIVCINIAGLLLARGITRTGEFAIRASLGAGRKHLFMQTLTESGILALAGGIFSLPVASGVLRGIQAMIPTFEVGTGFDVDLNTATLMFAAGATATTVLIFGLLPALRATRTHPGAVVKGQASQASSAARLTRVRDSLAAAQIGFSMMLLAVAGLFAQSLANVARVDLGLDTSSIVSFTVSPRLSGYGPERSMEIFDRLEAELSASPGISGVTSARVAILSNSNSRNSLRVEGFDAEPTDNTTASTNEVGSDFFETLGIPILAGRGFDESDTLDGPRVAIVNESFLQKFNLGMDALGTRFASGFADDQPPNIEIVGIAADAKYSAVKGDIPPQYFLPRRQDDNIGTLTYYVRGALEADTLFSQMRRTVALVDASLPIASMTTLEQTVDDNVFLDRLLTMFSVGFAGLASFLAGVGLYGVLAYSVAQRTRELGVRMALGATPGGLRRMVMLHVGRLALIGIPTGLVAAFLVGRAASALLFGLSGTFAYVLGAAAGLLVCIVAAAGWLPARNAARTTPMSALRYE